MEKSKKKDRAILVAVIGAIGVIAAALIAKVDYFIEPVVEAKTEVQKNTISDEQVNESENQLQKFKDGINDAEDKIDFSQFQVCFESIENKEQIKNFVVKYKGYNLQSKTDENGCTNVPLEIINREKSISSYTIRVMLFQGNTTSEEFEIGLTEISSYKIRLKK